MRTTLLATAATVILAVAPATAGEFDDALNAFLESDIKPWLGNEVLVEAIKAQNDQTAAYDAGKIDSMDKDWRLQVGGSDTPLIDSVLGHPASAFLQNARDEAGGLITEIFIMDAVGLNVAASDVTSDYWQGDEAKWQQTYSVGPDAVHISDVELDESTQEYQAQVSVSIKDPATGEVIGAATIGVNVGFLQ